MLYNISPPLSLSLSLSLSLPPSLSAQAIEGIGNLAMGKWQQMMVPIHEMTDVLRVVKDTASTSLKQGSWVRIKRGIYKDDIAQVRVAQVGEDESVANKSMTKGFGASPTISGFVDLRLYVLHVQQYMYMYVYVCTCMCVCMYVCMYVQNTDIMNSFTMNL